MVEKRNLMGTFNECDLSIQHCACDLGDLAPNAVRTIAINQALAVVPESFRGPGFGFVDLRLQTHERIRVPQLSDFAQGKSIRHRIDGEERQEVFVVAQSFRNAETSRAFEV